ncbi:MarR family winged helix-turn-helix transcriptional regulator [Consotaella aegiceratis]|uniref:MarR family winged helix-turn-helix transcriptional regulator n=1 Tax=Consotaella aegiceratis TaxID=3097961 RepID=UPI002F3E2FD8
MDKNDEHPEREPLRELAAELQSVVGRLKRRLREEATAGDLTPSQFSVLRRLERDGSATVTALARAEGMRPQSMSANIAALQALDLVIGTPDPSDGRQMIQSLTPHCRESLKQGRAARQDWLLRTIQARLTPQEQDDLARGIALLERLVDT